LLAVNSDSNLQIARGRCLTFGELSSACALDKLATESNCLIGSVLCEDLWDENAKVVSGHSHVQVLLEQISDVERVASGEGGLESSCNGVLSQVGLSIFALWIMDVESSWCGGWCLDAI